MKIKVSAILIILVLSFFFIKYCRDYKYQKLVDSIGSYQADVELITTRPFSIDTTTFNIKEYMSIFDQLTIENGYYPDYYYFDTFLEGEPKIVILKEGKSLENDIRNYSLKAEANDTVMQNEIVTNLISLDFYNHVCFDLNPLDHLIPEQTKYGYFQLLMFNLIGENFGLAWHAGYKHIDIICTKPKLLSHFKNIKADSTFHEFCQEERFRVKSINPSPKIKIRNDTCFIRILVFSEWGGYIRKTYPVCIRHPYQVGMPEVEVLAEYSSDIIY
jgi:hypothetical protein